jgi:hypothetical protein
MKPNVKMVEELEKGLKSVKWQKIWEGQKCAFDLGLKWEYPSGNKYNEFGKWKAVADVKLSKINVNK